MMLIPGNYESIFKADPMAESYAYCTYDGINALCHY